MLLPVSGQELPIRWLAQHSSEKPVTHVSRDELQALHIARAEELPAVTALAISHKTKSARPAGDSRPSQTGYATLTKFSLILVIQTWD